MAVKSSIIESNVAFGIKKLGFLNIKGTISDFQGNIAFDENDIENSSFDVSVSPASIDTGNPKRDEHLKNNDFFFVKDFPQISFKSTAIQKENNQFLAKGQLTILNETKEVAIPFSSENGVLKGDFSINRLDYKLGEKFPTFIVGKTVQININCKTK